MQDLFAPYEPPAHHPSHSRLYPEVKAENADRDAAINNTRPETNVNVKIEEQGEEKPRQVDYIEKYDPYDEGPFSLLAFTLDSDSKSLRP